MNQETSQRKRYLKYVNNWPAIISALAAFVSALMAYVSYTNNKALSIASLSLNEFKIHVDKVVPDQNELRLRFSFILENIGEEPIQIFSIKVLHVDINQKKAMKSYDRGPFLNNFNSGSVFTHNVFQTFTVADLRERDKDRFIQMIGDHAFIIRLSYIGSTYKENKADLYFLKFNGRTSMLSYDEYKHISGLLPQEFRRNSG
jgi:hypothetical protein